MRTDKFGLPKAEADVSGLEVLGMLTAFVIVIVSFFILPLGLLWSVERLSGRPTPWTFHNVIAAGILVLIARSRRAPSKS